MDGDVSTYGLIGWCLRHLNVAIGRHRLAVLVLVLVIVVVFVGLTSPIAISSLTL